MKPEKLTDCWRTPKSLLHSLRALYGPITLDPYSQEDNPTDANKFFTKDRPFNRDEIVDADYYHVFINPPFSRMRYMVSDICYLADRAQYAILVGLPNFSSKLVYDFKPNYMLTKWDSRLEFEPPPGLVASNPKMEAVVYIRSIYQELPRLSGWHTWEYKD